MFYLAPIDVTSDTQHRAIITSTILRNQNVFVC